MALVTCDFFSDALRMGTSVTVVLPETTDQGDTGVERTVRPTDPPLLYLLHGLSDDHTSWLRYTSVARHAEAAGLALVMPAAGRSFYADERHGHRYWTYVSEELPQVLRDLLGLRQSPASTYVAGLSMGGYGAMKLALRHPDRFAAVATMSGTLDLRRLMSGPDRDEIYDRVFGGAVAPEDDLLHLLDQPAPPRLWVGCGTDDFLHRDSVTFVERARALGHATTVDFRPGDHTWTLWDAMIATVIPWLLTPSDDSPAPATA